MKQHIVAIFESDEPAAAAARGLEEAGIPEIDLKHYSNGATDTGNAEAPRSTRVSGALASSTTGLDGDAGSAGRPAATGSTVLSVTVSDDSQIHQAVSILESHHPAEIDESTEEEADEVSGLEFGQA